MAVDLKAAYQAAGGDKLRHGYNPAGPVVSVNAPRCAIWSAQNARTLTGQHDAEGRPQQHYERARSDAEERVQTELLRDIFGNPFRPISSGASRWPSIVKTLAQAAYDEHGLPGGELDAARLAVLADALEEAGCSDSDILTHLRSPGAHVRGCWPVDLVLGKA
jgi:hypothetical protein